MLNSDHQSSVKIGRHQSYTDARATLRPFFVFLKKGHSFPFSNKCFFLDWCAVLLRVLGVCPPPCTQSVIRIHFTPLAWRDPCLACTELKGREYFCYLSSLVYSIYRLCFTNRTTAHSFHNIRTLFPPCM
ncbi:Hypothetical protein, putative [Bodo saltans]|uniref:Uncharacterized protein n=1 Tax=Bodo saltans TaxID=75058 RepID=A0A0S4JQT1_BODSA|nr:Hypothetical protein, putative [Bodo saltans]|eukprot:CUG92552.1 Hypothetical protein, putative [Bodo saltans]